MSITFFFFFLKDFIIIAIDSLQKNPLHFAYALLTYAISALNALPMQLELHQENLVLIAVAAIVCFE